MKRKFFFTLFLSLYFTQAFCQNKGAPILVTGGAGYIGTQTCKALVKAGFFPIVYDNLSQGYEESVRWGIFEKGDISDRKRVAEVIDKYRPVAVVHFAAFKSVGESVKDPAKYYLNNLCGSLILLDVMREKHVKKIIFSSTAAAYGLPEEDSTLLKETDACKPINPYGMSKWMVEKILEDFDHAYGMQYVVLRYFNVAGADLNDECGERGNIPKNLVPFIVQVAAEKLKELEIFGCDYPTSDGTAIRDYAHVVDVADAHVKALHYLLEEKPNIVLNIGTGKGFSVRQLVDLARQITTKTIPVKNAKRRQGDPPYLVADIKRSEEILGWKAKYSDLETILKTEWTWYLSLPKQPSP